MKYWHHRKIRVVLIILFVALVIFMVATGGGLTYSINYRFFTKDCKITESPNGLEIVTFYEDYTPNLHDTKDCEFTEKKSNELKVFLYDETDYITKLWIPFVLCIDYYYPKSITISFVIDLKCPYKCITIYNLSAFDSNNNNIMEVSTDVPLEFLFSTNSDETNWRNKHKFTKHFEEKIPTKIIVKNSVIKYKIQGMVTTLDGTIFPVEIEINKYLYKESSLWVGWRYLADSYPPPTWPIKKIIW
ncbi:MAG: hypothetical protein LBG58_11105 [Planctomycetaceae bacterium]|jgi:hypothetical protein|nr:hypothetical protein [Planctomycetaceae bacterium]